MTSNTKPQPTTHIIDATDRTLGRVASEAAHALLGKRSVHFAKNQAIPVTVTINNASKLHLPARRTAGKLGRKMGVSEIGSQVKLSDYLVDPLPVWNKSDDFTHLLMP